MTIVWGTTVKLIVLIFAIIMPISSFAQSQQIPKSVLDDLARDLSQVNQAVLRARKLQDAQLLSVSQPEQGVGVITVTNTSTNVHAGASDHSATIEKVVKGDTFPVIDKAGDWYAIGLPKSADGLNAGWVNAANVVPYTTANWDITGKLTRAVLDPVIAEFTTLAAEMKQKWAGNEYVSITGFSISIVPPDLSVDFYFK